MEEQKRSRRDPSKRRTTGVFAGAAVLIGAVTGRAGATPVGHPDPSALGHFKHLVVIYQENHSFDNLFGGWGRVGSDDVDGIGSAGYAEHATQIAQSGAPLSCLPQNDVNLTSPPLDRACGTVTLANNSVVGSHFANAPFRINDLIRPSDTTCPDSDEAAPNGVLNGEGAAGGCTRDIVHRFYQEQFQIHGGAMDRYALTSDALGLTQGYYDTTQLPVYQYLHSDGAPKYVVADHFFQAAFGGSFLNHQFLIAARAPIWANWTAAAPAHSRLDANGNSDRSPLYRNTNPGDGAITQPCVNPAVVFGERAGRACGDVGVNTLQPFNKPHLPTTADGRRLPAIDDTVFPNSGDELSDAGVPWAWYAGGWDNAAGNVGGVGWTNGSTPGVCEDAGHRATDVYPNCAGTLFQYHHQPFVYFDNYAEGRPGRAHLRDEQEFLAAARDGTLPAVSFVKPYGAENEHPGYASTTNGEQHHVDLIRAVEDGDAAGNTLIVVTYDEYGGQWAHVAPPGQGNNDGPHDVYAPGTRIPALLIGRSLHHSAVDSTVYDTTSILRTIELAFGLSSLDATYGRDANVNDLSNAIEAAGTKTS